MKKLYRIIWGKYRKSEKPKISCLLEKTLVLSIICSKCKNEDEKNTWKRRVNWNIKKSWFNWKNILTLKIWQKKT